VSNDPVRCWRALVVLAVLLAATLAPAQEVRLPDTPPARRLAKFFAAFNSGKGGMMRKFISENYTPQALAERSAEERSHVYLGIYEKTRGFDLRGIAEARPAQISAVAQARITGDWWLLTVATDAAAQDRIPGVVFRATPRPAAFTPHVKLASAEIAANINRYVDRLAKAGRFAGVVLITGPDGAPLLEKAVGDDYRGRPVTLRTTFGLASITKPFTAVSVAQLAAAGKLSFDDRLSKFLPGYPQPAGDQITIRELLTHTAGLDPYMGDRYFAKTRSLQSHIDTIGSLPLSFPPGTKFQYSNADYILLRAVVMEASGEDYVPYLEKHIFAPAGMKPAGEALMTASDLLRFAAALRAGKLLPPEMWKTVTTGQVPTGEPGVRYAFGFEERTINGERLVGHAGGAAHVSAQFDLYDNGYTVVVMSDRGGDPAGQIALRAADWITQK
jgi:D-alanyl-D-alanine carboxypeptidase